MILKTFLQPNLIKRYNNLYIRQKCDFDCKERCVNLISQQTESLNIIANHTKIISIVSIVNLLGPIILIGATSVSFIFNGLRY